MNKNLLLAAVMMLLPGTMAAQEKPAAAKNDTVQFTVVKANPITSIKDQVPAGIIVLSVSSRQNFSVLVRALTICARASWLTILIWTALRKLFVCTAM